MKMKEDSRADDDEKKTAGRVRRQAVGEQGTRDE
jgi:hypothetical protein